MIRITAKKNGFRRAGMAHHGTREYSDDVFTPEQIIQLEAEPMLVVQRLDEAPPATPAAEALKEQTEGETASEREGAEASAGEVPEKAPTAPPDEKAPEETPAAPEKGTPGEQAQGQGEAAAAPDAAGEKAAEEAPAAQAAAKAKGKK